MKLIIAGSRTIDEQEAYALYSEWLGSRPEDFLIEELVTGKCPTGPDQISLLLYKEGLIPEDFWIEFPADWDTYGKAAGPIRNQQMASYADALLLIWDGKSKGSMNMKNNMLRLNKPVYEIIIGQ